MVNVTFSLVGSNGDEIVFDDQGQFLLTEGISGIGIPSTQVTFAESASDGMVWRTSKRSARDVILPIMVFGENRGVVEANMRRLSNLLNDRRTGTILRASYSTGEVWELIDGHYISGAETFTGDGGRQSWARWVLSLRFANPFWISKQSEQIRITGGSNAGSLIPDLAELRIEESQLTGSITVENLGDVDAYPIWKFQGPLDSITITSEEGLSFVYDAPILLGEIVTIDTQAAKVFDENGDNLYANLGPSPKLFSLAPGSTDLTIAALGSDANTVISLFYQPRKEVVY